ncbi:MULTISPECIES: DUF1127 domain-containing protein [unclassified Bradyrhizobium]|uniref:DUF1127 domain-containing protein n=1 Tax=unclassified Bradyrhizobium TaxID=2631580 RepID=UPI0028EC79D9|nr:MULTISPECIES: hypothetical protein [unclassified Bradyrhizobium]
MAYSLAQRWATTQTAHGEGTLLQLPQTWLQRWSWRHELATLDNDQLRDCGLDPEAVRREATKPFWRA